jgi:hypothetical protein
MLLQRLRVTVEEALQILRNNKVSGAPVYNVVTHKVHAWAGWGQPSVYLAQPPASPSSGPHQLPRCLPRAQQAPTPPFVLSLHQAAGLTSVASVFSDVLWVGFVDAADLSALILEEGLKRDRGPGLRGVVSSIWAGTDAEHEVGLSAQRRVNRV